VGGGAFRLVNSWGTGWGDRGYVWVTYSAMRQIFLGAWAMIDGPNTDEGGGDGGGPLPAPTGFTGGVGEADYHVRLQWDYLPGADGFLLQRQTETGAWQTIAEPPADTYHHYDFNVEPDSAYRYRLAGVDAEGQPGEWATATGSTSPGGAAGEITLAASHPADGNAFPDRIALRWSRLSADAWYVVVRADAEEGLRNGQYFVLDVSFNGDRYDDYVRPASSFAYKVYAVTWPDYATRESNVALGATSGNAGGQDLGIVSASGDLFVTPGARAQASIDLYNYAGSPSESQRVRVGMEYYFADGSWGVYWHWDSAGKQAILDAASGTRIGSGAWGSYRLRPVVPEYLFPYGMANVGYWWCFHVDPLDAAGRELTDTDPSDNDYYTYWSVFVE
jgi:hypothetical protein